MLDRLKGAIARKKNTLDKEDFDQDPEEEKANGSKKSVPPPVSASQNRHYEKLKQIISEPIIDLKKLRAEAWYGIPM